MTLSVGDLAPNFSYTDEDGNEHNFHDIKAKKIVFFFPEAFTPGCTSQACSMNDSYESFKMKGMDEVIGVSMDSAEKQQKFKAKYDLSYPLVSDTDGKISKSYDVFNNFLLKKISGRVTYTVDENNIITNVVNSGIMGRKSGSLDHIGENILDLISVD